MADPDWADRLEELLYEGEQPVESAAVGEGRLLVTSHRLLAYAPGAEPRFREVDRPNVVGVTVETRGEVARLRRAVRPAAWGALLAVAGSAVSLDSLLVPVSAPPGTGLGGALATVRSLVALLALLDDAMLAVGALLLLVALVPVARYLRGRTRELIVEVAGGADLRLPAADAGEATARRVRAAVRPGPARSPGAGPGDGADPAPAPETRSDCRPASRAGPDGPGTPAEPGSGVAGGGDPDADGPGDSGTADERADAARREADDPGAADDRDGDAGRPRG